MISNPLAIPASIAYYLLLLYFFILWGRFILDLVRNFSRGWRPRGFGLVLSESVFALTDPPIRLVRRVIHPHPAVGHLGPQRLVVSLAVRLAQ